MLDGTLPTALQFVGIGYEVSADFAVFSTPDMSALMIVRPDGSSTRVDVPGLYRIGRPSLSGDGTRVAVQASETQIAPGDPNPQADTVYVVDLPGGTWHRVGAAPTMGDGSTQSEQPAFFPSGLDGPRFHVAVSADSTKIVIPGQMQIYNATTGALLADLHQAVMAGLALAGYQPDSRFPGAAGAGTFPLSGSFSPDGRFIAFDGAVQKGGVYGEVLARIGVDGQGFTVLTGSIPADPKYSNNFNFSELLPRWR